MNKSLKKIGIIIITLILMLGSIYTTKSFAAYTSDRGTDSRGLAINPDDYDPSTGKEEVPDEIQTKVNNVFSMVQIVGIVISTVGASVLGVKYILGSVEAKAEYKKTMIPYIIGIIFIACTPTIVRLIYNLTTQTLN